MAKAVTEKKETEYLKIQDEALYRKMNLQA
jgi:hypothetical protein